MATTTTRQALYEQVWSEPLVKLAKVYGVSDVTLGKLCKRFNIPRPAMGHWTRVALGKSSPQPPLPPHEQEDVQVSNAAPVNPRLAAARGLVHPVAQDILVPERLLNPHPFVAQTRATLATKEGRLWQCALDVNVTKAQLPRALLILDVIVKEVIARGLHIQRPDEKKPAVFVSGRDTQKFRLRERNKSIENPEYTAAVALGKTILLPYRYVSEPSGELNFEIMEYLNGGRKLWSDGKKTLEKQASGIVEGVLVAMQIGRIRREEQAEQSRRWAEQERLRQEEQRRAALERKENEALLAEAQQWHQVSTAFEYLDHVEASAGRLGPISDALESWLSQARKRLEHLDPTTRRLENIAEGPPA